MGGENSRVVLVLTERPDDYSRDLGRLGLKPHFASKVSSLLDKLQDTPACGFVLEVDRVMHANRAERDHLLKVVGSFPLLRSIRKGEDCVLSYLDDPTCFATNVKVFSPRRVRCHARVPVRLNVLIAPEDDLAFDSGLKTNLLDISTSGGFAYSHEDFVGQELVRLRILELSDPAPIQAHIRWRKPWGSADTLPGLGLLFVDIRSGQLDELVTRYISPPEEGELITIQG
jgi:hypothetical protein